MLIAQLTDIHVGRSPEEGAGELNQVRLRAVLDRLLAEPHRPDLLVLTGDVTENGDRASFARTAALLADCPLPVWPVVGNHDTREALVHAFPQVRPAEDGFLHYVVEQGGLRLVMLDTIEPGRGAGAFCDARAAWLAARLAEAPATPTLIFMHHPPVASGIDWMDPPRDAGWIDRFGAAIDGHRQLRAICCGHLHRPMATALRGVPVQVAPSVAPLLALDLRAVDPERPDQRALVVAEPPAYALHRWDGEALATHYAQVGDWPIAARYTEELQPMIRQTRAEQASS